MKPNLERIKEIFSLAMQKKSPAERERFLADTCQGDLELRQQVESLLRAEQQAGEFLGQTVQLPPSNFVAEKPGDKIGRYKLLQQIGEGGCGVVYMADQEEPVKRRVALKVIKPGMDTKEVLGRFEAERQALALMDHPNIAKVLEAGATETGRPFFVMELVRGIPITRYCDENKLNTEQRLELFIQVCQAIQHAHQKGIIHRDIKPFNVLVADHDGVPVPKIIDFGIAKATSGQTLTDKTVFTALEQFVGTPAYMSPEQAKMSGLDIDTRSDIYSLGVLLYELLTGKTPFDATRLFEAGFDEIRRVIREEEPPRPSQKISTLTAEEQTTTAKARQTDTPRLLHLVRGDLDWIVMKCLEKDRNRRYETANGLASDLERHINNEPVVARPPSNVYRFQKMVRRNKLAFAAGTAVAAAVLIGLAVSTYLFIQERRAHDRALAAEHNQSQLRQEAEAEAMKAKSEAVRAEAAEQEQSRLRKEAETESKKAKSEAERAEAAANEVRMNMAASDFSLAVRLIEEDHRGDALAYLARSLSLNPTNEAVAMRLASLLAHKSWWVPIRVLQQSGEVRSAQFNSDGKRILTVLFDATARVWDAQSGLPLTKPLKYGTNVNSAQFSPDGKRIVTASSDNSARVWDAQTGQPLTEPLRHAGQVNGAQFSPDGKWIVTTSKNTACVWDAQTGQPLIGPLKHDSWVSSAQFSPDGKWIVTDLPNNGVKVWDAQTGLLLTEPFKNSGIMWSGRWQFSPEGQRIVTASWYGAVRIWDAQSGESLAETLQHRGPVNSAQFSPDGMQIVTTAGDTVQVWEALGGQPLTEPLKHSAPVDSTHFVLDGNRLMSAQFSPDGKRILTATDDCTARVWDAQSGQALIEPLKHGGPVRSAQFSPDGKRILTASGSAARVWDAQSGQLLIGPLKHGTNVMSAQFSLDGKQIVTASEDKTARVWDAQSGQPLTEPIQHSELVLSAQFSPDGKRIVTASGDAARVWNAQSGQPLTGPLKHGANVNSAQFSPDGKRIVTASDDFTGRVWDAQSGQPLTEPLRHSRPVHSAQFSPDGKQIVTASFDATARVWDAQSGQPLTDPLKHGSWVWSAQFSPDGKRIVTASWDVTALVWDAQSGQPLTDPLPRSDFFLMWSAQFDPDGKRIVTASGDGAARVWDMPPSSANHPAWLPQLAEVISGQVLNKQGLLVPTRLDRVETINQLRQKLYQAPDDDDWVHWGRWFLADPATRTISPFSKITVPQYIENRIKENTAASLAEAESLASGNTELSERIAQAQSRLEQTTRAAKP